MSVKIYTIEVYEKIDFDNPGNNPSGDFNSITIDKGYAYSRDNYAPVAEPLEFGATYLVASDGSEPALEYGEDAFHAWQEDVMSFFEHTDDDIAASVAFNALCDTTSEPILFSASAAAEIAQVMEDFYSAFSEWIEDPGYTTPAEANEFIGIWEDVENCMLCAAETGSMVIKEF